MKAPTRKLRLLLAVVTIAAVFGCSGEDIVSPFDIAETPEVTSTDTLHDSSGKDTAADLVIPDMAGFDTASLDTVAPETVEDVDQVDYKPGWCEGSGEFGCPCDDHNDCLSGFCVSSSEGKVCSESCVDDCPDGWTCSAVQTSGSDTALICIQHTALLCKPCKTNDECLTMSGEGGFCVDYGEAGGFCGIPCESFGDCPDGYDCSMVTSLEGLPAWETQCTMPGNGCTCSPLAIELGATTTCPLENEHGVCLGIRGCTDEGLTACDGQIPAEEACNLIDDDCDGQTDEALTDGQASGCLQAGVCGEGVQIKCVGGEWDCDYTFVPEFEPVNETSCDGLDNDCDGETDEGQLQVNGNACPVQGVCSGGLGAQCIDGAWVCTLDDVPGYESMEVTCDGLDNDCDGVTDESFSNLDGDSKADCVDEDIDGDGILDDGDGSGVAGDTPCTGGATIGCDDNCPTEADASQTDSDNDGIGDVCEDDTDGDGDPDVTDCAPEDPTKHHGALELCNGIDDNCDGVVQENELDKDGDGTRECAGDCDDLDDTIYPGAFELCDGEDNDCDGVLPADEVNADGDTYMLCAGDCDDTDSLVFPGAVEICDGKDNDCDGLKPANEVDEDGDGVRVCGGDCNDGDATIYPGAIELCDGLDNDCSNGVPSTETDDDGDMYSECQGDCNDADSNVKPGGTETCDYKDNDCDGDTDEGLTDTWEPNQTRTAAKYIGKHQENSDSGSATGNIHSSTDVDWYKVEVDEQRFNVWDNDFDFTVTLTNIPTGQNYDLCAYYKRDNESSDDWSQCSTSTGSNPEQITHTMDDSNSDDDGYLYIKVTPVGGSWDCNNYQISWAVAE